MCMCMYVCRVCLVCLVDLLLLGCLFVGLFVGMCARLTK